MRVIIITSSSNRSGGTRQAVYQAQGLSERGHDVALCLPHDSTLWELPNATSNPLWNMLPEDPAQHRTYVESLFPSPDTPTIVHAFHNKAVKRVAWWGLFWRNRKLACVAHRGVIYRPGNPLPYLSPSMKAFLPNSEACARAITWCCPKHKIHVIPNGIPDDRVIPTRPASAVKQELDIPEQALIFTYVGNNNPAKGIEPLLKAFSSACLDAYLVMVGANPDLWLPLCDTLGIREKVRLIGQTERVSDYLQIADAFVFPSKNMDSAPNTLLEAIRMGLPVVAATVGGVPEIAQNNGLLVPPDDTEALTRALQEMASDPERRKLWGANSARRGQSYSVEARCVELEKIYHSVL